MFFTVIATFSDSSKAVHQYEAAAAEDAVRLFVTNAALTAYNRSDRQKKPAEHLNLVSPRGLRGVWYWNPTIALQQGKASFFGTEVMLLTGEVIQTDPAGPVHLVTGGQHEEGKLKPANWFLRWLSR